VLYTIAKRREERLQSVMMENLIDISKSQ